MEAIISGALLELIVAVVFVLLMSGLSSCTEVALFSVPYSRVLSEVNAGRRWAAQLQRVKDEMARPIMTIVIWNNVFNIVGSIAVGSIAARAFGSQWLGMFSAALTLAVIVFAEIIPKTIGERYALTIALAASVPVLVLSRVLLPLIWLIEVLVRPFMRVDPLATSEEEITALAQLGRQSGVIEADESELIQRVFRLNDIPARDMMTPAIDIDVLEAGTPLGDLARWVQSVTHTRIPVHQPANQNQIIGVVNVRDVLRKLAEDQDDLPIEKLAEPAHFVPDTMVGDDLLRHFQQTKRHLAVVVDALGTVLGVITLEDVLEELVGEIVDESDVEKQFITRLSPNAIRVAADSEMHKIHRQFPTDIQEEGRIGERVLAQLGYIPKQGQQVRMGGVRVTVEEATPRRIRTLLLERIDTDRNQ